MVLSERQEEIYKNLVDDGYDPFDLSDKFYREICTPYTSENGTDVLLDDREEFVYSTIMNESGCLGDCEYVSYSLDTRYMKCECPVNNTYTTLDILGGRNGVIGEFKYRTLIVQILFGIIKNSTKMSVLDFANEYLFTPLGIEKRTSANCFNAKEQLEYTMTQNFVQMVLLFQKRKIMNQ